MSKSIAYGCKEDLENDLSSHGFRIQRIDPINDATQYSVEGQIIVVFYESKGVALFLGERGHVAYAALSGLPSTDADSLGTDAPQVLIFHESLSGKVKEVAMLLRAISLNPQLRKSSETTNDRDLLTFLDLNRSNLQFALFVVKDTELKPGGHMINLILRLSYALGRDRVVILRQEGKFSHRNIPNYVHTIPFKNSPGNEVGSKLLYRLRRCGGPMLQRDLDAVLNEN
ncbi:MAG TPA: hypothetical protein PLI09_12520 [Candidatus Hydrogenedentes bacterium]|nr:hypothetical protein [Candidatus Hydrogenedentota bacterium]